MTTVCEAHPWLPPGHDFTSFIYVQEQQRRAADARAVGSTRRGARLTEDAAAMAAVVCDGAGVERSDDEQLRALYRAVARGAVRPSGGGA